MVQDPLNPQQPANRGWGWNRDPWGAGCGWFALFWVIIILIFAGWGWWGGGWWGGRGWNNVGNNPRNVPQAGVPMHVTNNYYFGSGADEFLGMRITLRGKVDHVFNDQVFTLAPEGSPGVGLLVVMNQQAAPKTAPKKGEEVEVSGTVRNFNRADFEKQTKGNLDKENLAAFRQRPVILGTSLKPEEHPVGTENQKGSP